MEESILFKFLLNSNFLCIDKEEIKTIFLENLKPQYNNLKQILNEKQLKAVDSYTFDLERHMFEIRDIESFKMLYLGIKLGMEVNEFCNKENED